MNFVPPATRQCSEVRKFRPEYAGKPSVTQISRRADTRTCLYLQGGRFRGTDNAAFDYKCAGSAPWHGVR